MSEDWTKRAMDGHIVTDIGQIDKLTRRRLNLYWMHGILIRGKDISYPTPKTYWVNADYSGPVPGPVERSPLTH